MITRIYPNAKGELQEVTLSQTEWEAMTQEDLDRLLAPEPELEPVPAPAPKPTRRTKK
ncbi:MAG: hypothetical protein ABFD96_15290 [Armatimonadia bacterium]